MSESWHKTETDLDAEKHVGDFWSRHRDELQSGDFWADRIKQLRGEPIKRLEVALENMPLPASFREAAIATRALIRDKRKQKASYDEELALLYWLSAINSFSIPYSEVLKEPGYNVIESIPGKKLKGLPFSYKSLGYEKLELLNKTDIKWLTENWGEPDEHTTLHEMHNDVWVEYELKLKGKRKQLEQEFLTSIGVGANAKHALPEPSKTPKNSKSTKWVAVAVVLFALLLAVVLGG
jgi:hypothetical protein